MCLNDKTGVQHVLRGREGTEMQNTLAGGRIGPSTIDPLQLATCREHPTHSWGSTAVSPMLGVIEMFDSDAVGAAPPQRVQRRSAGLMCWSGRMILPLWVRLFVLIPCVKLSVLRRQPSLSYLWTHKATRAKTQTGLIYSNVEFFLSLIKHPKPHIMFCKPAFRGAAKKDSAASRPHKMHKTL